MQWVSMAVFAVGLITIWLFSVLLILVTYIRVMRLSTRCLRVLASYVARGVKVVLMFANSRKRRRPTSCRSTRSRNKAQLELEMRSPECRGGPAESEPSPSQSSKPR